MSNNFPKPTPQNPQSQQPSQGPLLNEIQTEVSKEAEPFLQFLTTHALKIMMVLALLVVIVIGYGAYNWHHTSTLEEAQAQLGSIMLEKKGDERLTALEDFLKTAPKQLEITTLLNIADSSMQDSSYEKAAQAYGRIVALEKDSALALLSGLNQGQALMLAGKAKEALPILEQLANTVPTEQKLLIQESVVEAALQSNDIAKAKATLEAMANTAEGVNADLWRHRARNLTESETKQ